VVSVAGGVALALAASSDKEDLDACRGSCSQDDVDAAQRKFLFGDILLGVGVLSLATAAVLVLTAAPRTASAATRPPGSVVRRQPRGPFPGLRVSF
jgi:hypothetical protein